jgi:D-sedoheptulose 7-phosphate isomerase
MDPIEYVKQICNANRQVIEESSEVLAPSIVQAAQQLSRCLLNEHKILTCGNGGSAAQAQYLAAKMLSRYEMERPGLPSIALTADASTLTSIATDYQFADIFAKQIRALGQANDIVVVISTSGESDNIINAIDAAHDREIGIVLLNGADGGRAARILTEEDIELRVPSWSTARIQEVHLMIIHCLCDLLDRQLLGVEEIRSDAL